MKNKRIFSLSPALAGENLKMYWYLPALSFIVYFMAGIFPLLVDKDLLTDSDNTWFLESSLCNYNVAYCILMVAVPLIAAVMVMGFLHNPTRATAIHSQPFSRNKIFCSHILTGWVMCIIPIVVMLLIYIVMMQQVDAELYYQVTVPLYWAFTSMASITFFYGMFVLAGSLVGNSVMHVLLSGVFFGIIPLIVWITMMFCEGFLAGFYSVPDPVADFLMSSNPLLTILSQSVEPMPAANAVIFLISGLIMLILSFMAYSRAKLEHVGDSMMYRLFEEIITWLIVFVGMSAFGYFFYSLTYTKSILLVGMAFGSILSFVIVKIILNRSIKIFNKGNLISFGIYVIIACLFTGITVYDMTGFAKRVPDVDNVASVNRGFFGIDSNTFSYSCFKDGFIESDDLDSPEAIEKVIALHQYIVDSKLYLDEPHRDSGSITYRDSNGYLQEYSYCSMIFKYVTKGGGVIEREFSLQPDETVASLLNDIYSSDEYKQNGGLSEKIKAENVSYIQLFANNYNISYSTSETINAETGELLESGGGYAETKEAYDSTHAAEEVSLIIDNPNEIKEFLAALREDSYNRTYHFNFSDSGNANIESPEAQAADGNMVCVDVRGEIVMKDGSDGTVSAVHKSSIPHSTVDFWLSYRDTNTLGKIQSMFEKEGYDYYAKLIKNQLRLLSQK